MAKMYAIGIDIGTTSICGVLIDAQKGGVVRSEQVPNSWVLTGNSWERVQDAKKIFESARGILDRLICEGVAVIGVTGQMHGICYLDSKGEVVSNLYTWQDRRADLPYKNGQSYAQYLGVPAGYGNATHFYHQETGQVPEGASCYGPIYDCFAMHICGKKRPVLHTGSGAALGLFDLEDRRFTVDVPVRVTEECELLGSYRGIPVALAVGDNQASFLGSVKSPADILVNIGTGSQVSAVGKEAAAPPAGIELRPYFQGQYLLVGAALCGGKAYAMLKDFYTDVIKRAVPGFDGDVYGLMDRMLADFQGEAPRFDNSFCGSRSGGSPYGSISLLREENFTPGAFVRGILQGIADELYGLYLKMDGSPRGLACSGNGVRRNHYLKKTIGEKFGAAPKITRYTEEASYGAAMFALVCCGVYRDIEEVSKLVLYEEGTPAV